MASYAVSVRGETVLESPEDLSETQAATLDLSMDEISLPRSPVATEVETTFNSPETVNGVVHSSSKNKFEELGKLSSPAVVPGRECLAVLSIIFNVSLNLCSSQYWSSVVVSATALNATQASYSCLQVSSCYCDAVSYSRRQHSPGNGVDPHVYKQ